MIRYVSLIYNQMPLRNSISASGLACNKLLFMRLCRNAIIFELRFFIISYKNFFSFYCWVFSNYFIRTSADTSFSRGFIGADIGIGNLKAPSGIFGVLGVVSGFCLMLLTGCYIFSVCLIYIFGAFLASYFFRFSSSSCKTFSVLKMNRILLNIFFPTSSEAPLLGS